MTPASAELRTLRLYGALLATHARWAHRLVLTAGPGAAASQAASAASIAGAASLVIEHDASTIKAAQRHGAFDFIVHSLDEALRTLKNELRQGRPLAVGLIADEAAALGEAHERGLLPDVVLALPATPEPLLLALRALGAHVLPITPDAGSDVLSSWLGVQRLAEFAQAPGKPLPAAGSAEATHWLTRAPLYLRSARAGVTWSWQSTEATAHDPQP